MRDGLLMKKTKSAGLLMSGDGADLIVDLSFNCKALNIPIDENTIEKFLQVDDENNEEFVEDVNELEIIQAINNNAGKRSNG